MKLYQALLWLYPGSFRAEYGGEMRAMFARRWQQATSGARLLLWLEALGDVLRNARRFIWTSCVRTSSWRSAP